MIDEKADVSTVIKGMTQTADGRAFITLTITSWGLLLVNLLWPTIANDGYGGAEKWVAVWTLMPLLLFLIYVRTKQLIESESKYSRFFRCLFTVAPVVTLVYFNFLGIK